jgi:hypothetical protein
LTAASWRALVALILIVGAAAYACLGLVDDPWSLGTLDWDKMEAYRQFAITSFLRFHQFPLWDPYGCGGHPYWADPEAGTTIVSALLPAYLLLPLGAALRLEVAIALAAALAGAWVLSGRFCRDPVLRAVVCMVAVLNSRWALQAAAGHPWHLYYAALPWSMYAFLRADEGTASSGRWLLLTSACLAYMVYAGAIYPFPHTILAIGLYAAFVSYRRRDRRTITRALLCFLLAIGLAAPKLLPLVDTMSKYPRTVSSREYLDPISYLLTFAMPSSARSLWPYWNLDYGYYEYGIYVGLVGVVVLVAGAWRAPETIELRGFRLVALAFIWLSLGLFGPWVLLHLVPPFRSQHVPFRFAYPGLLFLAIVSAANIERRLTTARASRAWSRWHEAAVIALATAGTADIAYESRRCLAQGFGVHPPDVTRRSVYAQTFEVPVDLSYPEANMRASLGTHRANVGSILCGTFHAFNIDAWKASGARPRGLGARGLGEPEYRGEAFLEGGGTADFVDWTPSMMVVQVHGARSGDLLVLNQNFDEGWKANGAPTLDHGSVNAYRLHGSDERVVFVYRPRTLWLGLAVAFASLAAVINLWLRSRSLARPTAMKSWTRPSSLPGSGPLDSIAQPVGPTAGRRRTLSA